MRPHKKGMTLMGKHRSRGILPSRKARDAPPRGADVAIIVIRKTRSRIRKSKVDACDVLRLLSERERVASKEQRGEDEREERGRDGGIC